MLPSVNENQTGSIIWKKIVKGIIVKWQKTNLDYGMDLELSQECDARKSIKKIFFVVTAMRKLLRVEQRRGRRQINKKERA